MLTADEADALVELAKSDFESADMVWCHYCQTYHGEHRSDCPIRVLAEASDGDE
jgi:hypothetical protein